MNWLLYRTTTEEGGSRRKFVSGWEKPTDSKREKRSVFERRRGQWKMIRVKSQKASSA